MARSLLLQLALLALLASSGWGRTQAWPSSEQHPLQPAADVASRPPVSGGARHLLNFSSPAPHLVASTATLLQQWANTVFPNGHTIAPVQIPPLTLFFHGRVDAELPPSPEWLAFDQEMSWGIMGGTRSSFMLTYQTTRPVKALYFDGESATLMGLGQLDTQMLHLWGNVSGPAPPDGNPFFRGLRPEYERARGLCDWLREAGLRGPGWGFEGVVRMNAGFEMIWCDFTSPSLRLLTHLNVTAPQLSREAGGEEESESWAADETVQSGSLELFPEEGEVDEWDVVELRKRAAPETSYYTLPPIPTKTDRATDPSHPPSPPNWRRDRDLEPFLSSQVWGWFDSATWHYGSSKNGPGLGETRAKVLSCGVLSYYSPQFANQTRNRALEERQALNLTDEGFWRGPGPNGNRTTSFRQLGRRRRYHHLGDVNTQEAALMRANSERALKSLLEPYNDCSGADWTQIGSEMIQRTTFQIKMLESLFSVAPQDADNKTALRNWLFDLRAHSHLSMVTYLEYPSKLDASTWQVGGRLFNETYARCQYRYTRLLVPEEGIINLVLEEKDLMWAVEETQGAICSVLLAVGFGIEEIWYQLFGKHSRNSGSSSLRNSAPGLAAPKELVREWADSVSELTAWLGWESEVIGCEEVCAWDERCYIPMWPLLARNNFGGRPPGNGTRGRRPGGYYPPGGNNRTFLPPNGTYPGRPGFQMPPRGPAWMGDETDLWEPKCIKSDFIAPRR